MGNNPSTTSKPSTPQPAAASTDYTRTSKRDQRAVSGLSQRPISIAGAPALSTVSATSAVSSSMPQWSPSTTSHAPLWPDAHGSYRNYPTIAPSKPVDVPQPTGAIAIAAAAAVKKSTDFVHPCSPPQISPAPVAIAVLEMTPSPSTLLSAGSMSDMSYLTRPPRLPLPIESELHTPGSPIVGPAESGDDLAELEDQNILLDQQDDLTPFSDPAAERISLDTVSQLENATGAVDSLTLNTKLFALTTGEDDMTEDWPFPLSPAGPTVPVRIEWTGGGDRVYVTGTIFQWTRKFRLIPVEGKAGHFESTINIVPGTHHIRFIVDGVMQTSSELPTTVDLANNLVNYIEVTALPTDFTEGPDYNDSIDSQTHSGGEQVETVKGTIPKTRSALPSDRYLNNMPQYLIDFDQSEETQSYQYAIRAINKMAMPPSLPGFLSKPILNAPTVIKEDSSVLHMPPNHTVLNHLATSSIKNQMLAVSVTTRYKSKFVTTIMYKPTASDDGATDGQ